MMLQLLRRHAATTYAREAGKHERGRSFPIQLVPRALPWAGSFLLLRGVAFVALRFQAPPALKVRIRSVKPQYYKSRQSFYRTAVIYLLFVCLFVCLLSRDEEGNVACRPAGLSVLNCALKRTSRAFLGEPCLSSSFTLQSVGKILNCASKSAIIFTRN